ncbi:MAG TPA: sigma-70 family RNA polymerase sigma factor [Kiritimatiellia bacterium]|nr:sigma-70 family RNA polymerase sigma factor [Kiritimatiellia bacterium]HRU71570.1 sigma-70 family RNA polymerase sigma factor [Kiritimatiellia bacterium]
MWSDRPGREEPYTQFAKELTNAQFDLFAFVSMLLGNRDAAKDVLQETNVALLRHAAEYDTRCPFLPWAKAFAYNQVRAYLKRESRERLVFDDALVATVADDAREVPVENGRMMELLDLCLGRLAEAQKRLIQDRYFRRESIAAIAHRLRRSEISVYVQIHRIRRTLGACIEDRMNVERSGGRA